MVDPRTRKGSSGRTFANLAMTMPEARPAGGFDPTTTRVGNFAMNGGDGRQLNVNVNVDGGDNKDNAVGSLLQNFAYESGAGVPGAAAPR